MFEKKSSKELPWEQPIRRKMYVMDNKEMVLLGI
jgi:hypothetical protein